MPRISSPPPPVTNLEMPPPPSVNIVEEESLDEEKAEPSHDDFNVFSQGIRGVTVKVVALKYPLITMYFI